VKTRPSELPDYTNPPIDEVILGAQFNRLPNFTQAHVGLLWSEVKDKYPRTQDQPPLIGPFKPEMSGVPFFQNAGAFRVWLLSADDTEILQIQNDRILRNWRRRPDIDYPRFEPLLDRFMDEFRRIDVLVGPCMLEQVEVTYINWIVDSSPKDFFIPAGGVEWSDSNLRSNSDGFQWADRASLNSPDGESVGSLSIVVNSARRPYPPPMKDGTMLTLTFTAPVNDAENIEDLMVLGRNTIVQAFTDVTTERAQSDWGRTQ
jgi:uncharacterized protein (TIGR04255 family)